MTITQNKNIEHSFTPESLLVLISGQSLPQSKHFLISVTIEIVFTILEFLVNRIKQYLLFCLISFILHNFLRSMLSLPILLFLNY